MSFQAKEDNPTINLLSQIQATLQSMQQNYVALSAAVETINGRINVLSGVKEVLDNADREPRPSPSTSKAQHVETGAAVGEVSNATDSAISNSARSDGEPLPISSPAVSSKPNHSSRIILTTYPGQSGIDPLKMNWGHKDPIQRGPVVVSRSQSTLRRRNGEPFLHTLEHCRLT